jgi:hypothetical protein
MVSNRQKKKHDAFCIGGERRAKNSFPLSSGKKNHPERRRGVCARLSAGTSLGAVPAGTSSGAPSPPPPSSCAVPLLHRSCCRHSTAMPPPSYRTTTCATTRLHHLRVVVLLSSHGESMPPEAGSRSPTSSVQRSRNFATVAPGHRGPPRRRPPARSVLPRECGPNATHSLRMPA